MSLLRNHKLSLLSKTRLKIFIKNIYQHNKWKTGCFVLSCFSSALLFYRAQSAFRKGHLPAATMICPERVPCPNWTLDQTHGDAHLAKTDDRWWCPECPKFCPFAQVMGGCLPWWWCPTLPSTEHMPNQTVAPLMVRSTHKLGEPISDRPTDHKLEWLWEPQLQKRRRFLADRFWETDKRLGI